MTVSNISEPLVQFQPNSGIERTKICLNGPGHLANMAALPVDTYWKNHKKPFSLEPIDLWP